MRIKLTTRPFCIVALLAIMFSTALPHEIEASPLTYTLDSVFIGASGASATGFIETDGTIGVLGATNILGWDIVISQSFFANSFEFKGVGNGDLLSLGGSALTATPDALFFDFGIRGALFELSNSLPHPSVFCLDGSNGACFPDGNAAHTFLRDSSTGNSFEVNIFPANSDTLIANLSAVPEPSTWAMLLLGFAGIGAMTYRRRKFATA